ncbi:GPI mannosyltransferase 1 [Vermiconidia calcicola]|uniref:GPI mannosyltransferase 1 n=1 Tax=Vermiconidia calcicola TaxID=1690605 RepID=A0ACC3NDV1_9PEZI|nr:GPI mannosyltransferase 1 [Vermiconidia calcicola]
MPMLSSFFSSPWLVFGTAILFRLALLIYGRWQDANSPIKYTDIDYLVFTDAARFVARGHSPYDRATYRYTPLLAWLLIPTTWDTPAIPNHVWFDFGKLLFAAGDIATGWLIMRILVKRKGMSVQQALKYASLWLLNPMVANISTRGSSEGLLAVLVVALVWAVLEGRIRVAGMLLGLGVHFKIYPFIYAASIWWWLGSDGVPEGADVSKKIKAMFTKKRIALATNSFLTFMALNCVMYYFYGVPFIEHSYRYHFTRIDHRHNFSVYNTVLHLNSAHSTDSSFKVESIAFVPQLFLSVGVIPFLLAKKDLASTMLAQTFAFVTFNKVCTSQYFLWYMVFIPFYLPSSSMLRNSRLGLTALVLWVLGQALWLQQGFELEFNGKSTFVPGLWLASMLFFGINCWILGVIVQDVGSQAGLERTVANPQHKKDR